MKTIYVKILIIGFPYCFVAFLLMGQSNIVQEETNSIEWENPSNWTSGFKWFSVYPNHGGPRTWVPKRNPKLGWTLNLANPEGVIWLFEIFLGINLLITAVFIGMMIKGRLRTKDKK